MKIITYMIGISFIILFSNCSILNSESTSFITQEIHEDDISNKETLIPKVNNTSFPTSQESHFKEIGDGGFLTHKPCGPPCFWGIIPGISSESDVINRSNGNNVLSTCSIFDYRNQGGIRGMLCNNASIGFTGNDIVNGVTYYPSDKIMISQIIDVYGIPNGIYVDRISLPDSPSKLGMILWYNQIQTKIFIDQDGDSIAIKPDTVINRFDYLSRESYDDSWSSRLDDIINWKGYGVYAITEK